MSAEGLRLSGVGYAWGDTPALRGIELAVAQGEFLCLLGPSGSGKSTLLRLLAGLERPAAGYITWLGQPLAGPGKGRAVVFQDYSLFPWMSVERNVALAVGKAYPVKSTHQRLSRARDLLERVGLGQTSGKYPFELSGGMRQRAAIARALALDAPLLLLDEPFGALDPVNRARLQDVLLDVWQADSPRKTIVFVTHDVDEALYLGDRIAILGSSPGHLVDLLPVPFARPRRREALYGAADYEALREAIALRLNADTLARLEAA